MVLGCVFGVLNGFWTGFGWWLGCGAGFGWETVGVGFLVVGSWVLWFCCKLVWGLWVVVWVRVWVLGVGAGLGVGLLVFGFSDGLRSVGCRNRFL